MSRTGLGAVVPLNGFCVIQNSNAQSTWEFGMFHSDVKRHKTFTTNLQNG